MAKIVGTFLDAFNTALSTGLSYKLQHDQLHGEADSTDFIHLHAPTISGETYKPFFQMINEKYPSLFEGKSSEEIQCILNSMGNAIEKGRMMLQNQNIGDFEVRMVSLKDTRPINNGSPDVLINDYYGAFPKVKNFFKSSSSIVYLGGLIVVKNLSPDNGAPLDVSVCEMVSSTNNISDPSSYDGEGSTTSVYNKDIYVRFFPSTTLTFYTKPVTEIISQYTTRDDWQDIKQDIFTKLAEKTHMDVNELKNGGAKIRCISGISQLAEEGVMNYDSFKQNSATFDQTTDEKSYGPNIKLANTYLKFETPMVDEFSYDITLYELFLVGKSVNMNSDVNLSNEIPSYKVIGASEEEVTDIIDSVISPEDNPAVVDAIQKKLALLKYGKIIVKNGKFVEPYKDRKLKEGESIEEQKGEVFTLH